MFLKQFLFVKAHFGSNGAVKIVSGFISSETLLKLIPLVQGTCRRNGLNFVSELDILFGVL